MSFFRSQFLNGRSGGMPGMQAQAPESPQDLLGRIPSTVMPYLRPYVQRGEHAASNVEPLYEHMGEVSRYNPFAGYEDLYQNQFPQEYGRMASNPTDFLKQIESTYRPSAGYQYKENQLRRAAGAEAAAGGIRGTPYAQGQLNEQLSGILGQDMQQYLSNVLGIQGQGLSAKERQLAGRERFRDMLMHGAERGLNRQLDVLGQRAGMRTGREALGFHGAQDLANILGTNLSERAYTQQRGLERAEDRAMLERRNQEAREDMRRTERGNRSRDWLGLATSLGGAALSGMGGGGGGNFLGSLFGGRR